MYCDFRFHHLEIEGAEGNALMMQIQFRCIHQLNNVYVNFIAIDSARLEHAPHVSNLI